MLVARPHIMVVDDEALMRGLLKDFLESQGYQVSCYSSGVTALRFLRNGSKTDAIVADIRMSPMDGMELLKTIKEEAPALPVLLFTAVGSPEEQTQSLKLGAVKYLAKPFPLRELKHCLEQVLEQKNGFCSPNPAKK